MRGTGTCEKRSKTTVHAKFSKWGWNSMTVDEQSEYASTVKIYHGPGTLEVALGLIVAYWAGPAPFRV